MSDRRRRFYVTSVSGSAVVLSPLPNNASLPGAGLGIEQLNVVTHESPADQTFWGATGQCGNFEVIVRRVS